MSAHPRLAWGAAVAAIAAMLVFAWLLAAAAVDAGRAHADAARQALHAQELTTQLDAVKRQNTELTSQAAALRTENTKLQDAARSPTLAMWNACSGPCAIGPNAVRVGSGPDTFELQLAFTADVPVRGYVFTFHQWTQFDDCGFSTRCVTGGFQTYDAATSLDTTFAEAEGCSGYVWVLLSDRAGTIKPNVRVQYRPADHPTGVCAG